MKEVKIDKGILKFNRNAALFCTTTFVLASASFVFGIVGSQSTADYLCGGVLALNACLSGDICLKAQKSLKKDI